VFDYLRAIRGGGDLDFASSGLLYGVVRFVWCEVRFILHGPFYLGDLIHSPCSPLPYP